MLARLVGVLLVALVAVDIFQTVLLPSARGLLSGLWARLLWALASGLPGPVGHRARQAAGPLSIVTTIVSWLGLLWLAFALFYLPSVGALAYSPDVAFEGEDLVAALYFSGTALTTLGLGDIAAQSDALRLLVILESASGLAVFTAALGYLPAIYTVVSDLRTSAESTSDLQATTPERAAGLLQEDATVTLEGVRRDVISARQHLLRFPVLHYFHPPAAQSVLALVEGATMLWVVARLGLSASAHPGVSRQAEALELALGRLVDDAAGHAGDSDGDEGHQAATEQVERVRRAVARMPGWEPASERADPQALADLARTNAVMRRYAAKHGYAFPST